MKSVPQKGVAVGLRERKKDRTRADLLAVALELFDKQGFAETTINQIADAVDVSPRTLLRYFSTKEDIVVSWVEEGMSVFISSLADRPTSEAAHVSLLASARAMLAHYQTQASFYLTIERTIASSSAIRARKLEMSSQLAEQVTQLLKERSGSSGAGDWHAVLYPAVVFSVLRIVIGRWVEDNGNRPLLELFDEASALIRFGD
ncbi:TetR/AcrR family transcriptional regulator [Ancylobacter sp. WKF20]|uniref:TetR/AcrR family transcriptional regulator n=1 Tax=Ancylobacter sp. WKF20 TaxID=3039801 RepID=UPI0024345982|nr:TetR/AcrR family transcriptional regulator [Ancylobacter sp. WKF20]WGD32226.1 TetR/AcrR family transcriptional regulator [Ancylobacter sp. WKF20]